MSTLDEKERIFNKVKRFSLVVTLRKLFPLIILLLFLLLTFVAGVWNVRRVEYVEENLLYSERGMLEETFSSFVGKNIFFIDVSDIERDIVEKNSFVKSVVVEKVIPDRIRLTLDEYNPQYSFVFDNKCNLYSQEGIKIYEICEDCNSDCNSLSDQWKTIYIESNNLLDSDGVFMYSEEVGNITKVLGEFGYTIDEIGMDKGIATLYTSNRESFVFDLNEGLDIQLARMYLVGKKIDEDSIEFKKLDLRFERPVLKRK